MEVEGKWMMDVEYCYEQIMAPDVIKALLSEFGTITNYRTLRDSLPRRLASLLYCRCVLLYLRTGETLQLAAGSFDDKPGWSSALLAVAHINPISLHSDLPEACAWREQQTICLPGIDPSYIAIPLLYRQRCIGVMVVLRKREDDLASVTDYWLPDEVKLVEAVAGVVALLLENTRLLEHDNERIQELSLLNRISSHLNYAIYEPERLHDIVVQHTKEISDADLYELLEPVSEKEVPGWISQQLRTLLFQRFQTQRSPTPLILERPCDIHNRSYNEYLDCLPANIVTFFAIPLLSSQGSGLAGKTLLRNRANQEEAQSSKISAIIVGGYYRVYKLRRAELTLLQVLASQARVVLENMRLMGEVVEARNEARKLLRQVFENQRLKELILESMPSGLITTDQQGRIQTFNRAAELILGYHPYEVLGQSLHKFLDLRSAFSALPYAQQADGPSSEILYTSIYTGEAQSGTVVTCDRSDHELVLEVDIRPLCDDQGTHIGMLATLTDMTSIHQLEEEKRRLDRLASLGEMAANVAHEVRNPLASIKTSIQILQEDLQDKKIYEGKPLEEQTDWVQESVAVALKEVVRLDAIVHDLLLFAKPRQLQRARCSISELSELVLKLIQGQCEEANVSVQRFYEEIPDIRVDVGQLEQVLLNLYMNALQAMPEGGTLTIACRALLAERAIRDYVEGRVMHGASRDTWITYNLARQKDSPIQQWLELVVSDTGIGLAPDQLERIFQPFYTTKAHGIGLGLPITRRLIEDHSGYIRVESQFGYGTTVTVRLPLITEAVLQTYSAAFSEQQQNDLDQEEI